VPQPYQDLCIIPFFQAFCYCRFKHRGIGNEQFFSQGVKEHVGSSNQLMKLSSMLDYNAFALLLGDIHSDRDPTGYAPLMIFKAVLLKQWHSLFDPAIEELLRVRVDFLKFARFALDSDLPEMKELQCWVALVKLSARKNLFHNMISKQRFRIEQGFGTLRRRFNFRGSSYFTTPKTQAQMLMKCLCLNILKGLNKWEVA
jgi:Transposase domain (DUF772)/Transposase DDE domain